MEALTESKTLMNGMSTSVLASEQIWLKSCIENRIAAFKNEQKATNKEKSKTRARVEHVFGFMEQSMNGLFIRSVGIVRATGIIGLINLTYNLFRYEQTIRLDIKYTDR